MTKLTKQDIAEYYTDPEVRKKLLEQLRGKPLVAVQSLQDGSKVYRRNDSSGKPISIDFAKELAWYTDRRFSEFHPAVGKKTDHVWVDVDPGPGRSLDSVKKLTRLVSEQLRDLPGINKTTIAYSGGRGFHVHGELDKSQDVDVLRRRLGDSLKSLAPVGQKIVHDKKPGEGEVRLDVSTLKNTGSLRALYSLNADTGRVAIPLTHSALSSFKPSDADVKNFLKRREFAPGIPGSKKTHEIPVTSDRRWTMSVQEHDAAKAGKHWDLRLVDPDTGRAHSWAVPKMTFPDKRPILAVQTPTHSAHYALNFGAGKPKEIGSGYGKGTVTIKYKEPIKILDAGANKIKFERAKGETYMLFRTKEDKWLMKKAAQYYQGYAAALVKLGLAPSGAAATGALGASRTPSTGEMQRPLDMQDAKLPAGQLARVMTQMEDPVDERAGGSGSDSSSVEQRLNRSTTWSSPHMIPSDTMSGASPVQPGLGM